MNANRKLTTKEFYTIVAAGNEARIAELEILVATKPAAGTYYINQLAKAKASKAQYEAKLAQ